MSEVPIATDFDISTAALNAFYEQERSLDEMEEDLPLTGGGRDPALPPSPSHWVKLTARAGPSSHPPRLPLSSLANLAPSPSQPIQPTRTQRRNQKRRERRTALKEAAGIHFPWKELHRAKKVALSLSDPIRVDFPLSAFPVYEDDGFTGRPRNLQSGDRVVRSVDYFSQKGFRVIEWDGVSVTVLLVIFIPRC